MSTPTDEAPREEPIDAWARNQRALARALDLSLEDWLAALDAASTRTTGLTVAVVGAAVARGLGMSILDGLDGGRLRETARGLIDPRPPRVESPVLKEAIRRAAELGTGTGAGRLKRKLTRAVDREVLPTPPRETKPLGESAAESTPDAPGRRGRAAPKKRARKRPARGGA